ncbi:MAG: polysaccharide biosynthesis tyrosine autokinase [Bacteroidaceae bacterium]|nr:polysaccharide biosynthesis tyrosine autokinase [Bacteroidaceae bacterium]
MQENKNVTNPIEEEGFNINKIISVFFESWKLFLVSIVLCLLGAGAYLYFAIPQYRVTAKILLSDSQKGSFSSQTDMLADFGYQMANSNVENEIEVINSMSVARSAVYSSGVYISYYNVNIKETPIYKKASPINVSVSPVVLSDIKIPIRIFFKLNGEQPVNVRYECINETLGYNIETSDVAIKEFPYVLKTVFGDVLVEDKRTVEENPEPMELMVVINPLEATARKYTAQLSAAPVSKTSSVAILAVNTPVPGAGVDYLNAVIESYNNVTNEDKRQVARKTETFINSRLVLLRKELAEKEGYLAQYKKDNQLIDPKFDASQVVQSKSSYVKQLEELDMLIESSKYLSHFVNNPANNMKVIPTTFGMTIDQSLLTLINNYNREVVERNQLLQTATEDNPLLKSITVRVRAMQDDLRAAINALNNSLAVQRDAILMLVENYTDRFEMSPEIERELLALTRECDIKSGLYVMLLQKFEENALSLAVTADNLRCIDAPTIGGAVSPNRKMIIMVALFLGLAIPAGILYILSLINTKISSVEETSKMFTVPLVGTIPFSYKVKGRSSSVIVVDNKTNTVLTESFRSLRTNLQFVMKNTSGKVILLTSTMSGEGKTFVSSNLAVSIALLGKKVLLIGADIRCPRLAEMFNFNPKDEGLTSYLAADINDLDILDRCIKAPGIVEGCDLLPAGIVPPNPTELLSSANFDRAIEYLKTKYDYILIDSAPIGIVSDAVIVSRVSDVVVYVLRMDYSHKDDVYFMNRVVAEGKLENVSVVINGENDKKKHHYASRSRYIGYGYGDSVYGKSE